MTPPAEPAEPPESGSATALDLISKVVGVLAALLGTAGYVLVLGAAILWLRLREVDLPTEIPVSLGARQELIALGAQAVAVWALLVAALGILAAWIVTGDPARRRFGLAEGGLALAVTVAALFGFVTDETWMLGLPAVATALAIWGAWRYWTSVEAVVAALLPIVIGIALAAMLQDLTNRDGTATAVGIAVIFGLLVVITPRLQKWRLSQERNNTVAAHLRAEPEKEPVDPEAEPRDLAPIVQALSESRSQRRPTSVVWIERITAGAVALLVLGGISIASQLDHDGNFHRAVVTLANGDCLKGTYVIRGGDSLVVANPNTGGQEGLARVAVVPVKEVLAVQVFGTPIEGARLDLVEGCDGTGSLVRAPEPEPEPAPNPMPTSTPEPKPGPTLSK